MKEILLGNEAIARGAFEAGVKVVSSYPGTPSTEITESIARYERINGEWATNEKVGLEVAIGASIAGARAMSCMKHVGVNVAADPLFTASYTGVNGGLVVVAADDPGMHSSQNEQDSRHYARAAKVPMYEPADSQECKDYVKAAFALSERFDTPVMIRLTTRIAHSRSLVTLDEPQEQVLRPYQKNVAKYVMMPAMAIARHRVVEDRQTALGTASSTEADVGMHQDFRGSADLGIITAGICYQFVREAMPEASVLKLGLIWPLPLAKIREFAASVRRLVIVEELDPVLETEIRAAGIACEGKALFTLQGEYSAAMIRLALGQASEPAAALQKSALTAAPGRPPVMCAGCPHKGLFMALNRGKYIVSGDIGCYTLGALSPTNAMDACVCMGASVSMAHGMDKATDGDFSRRAVAVIGDSTFLHSGVTGLINSVYNQSNLTLIILDNSITGMTGHQQNPASGLNLRQQPAPAIDLAGLCRAIGVASIREIDPADTWQAQTVIAEETARAGVSVIIARRPCALIPAGRAKPDQAVRIDLNRCKRCKACIRIMCPALTAGPDGFPIIDTASCTNCGLCVRVCKFDALKKGGEA